MTDTSQVVVPAQVVEPAPLVGRGPGPVLAVLSLAAFMASLDVFIVNVAFDRIGADFSGASLADLSWVLNAYAIVYAALLVPLGRLADKVGRKPLFLLGLGVFTVASAACAASPGLWWLVSFRVLQAVGAAALTPTSLGLLLAAVPADRRTAYVRIWAAVGGFAAAVGPAVGGLLVTASWRWVFLVNVPVGVLALWAAWRVVPDSRDPAVTRLPDALGAGVLTLGVGSLALALVKGGDWGWADGRTVGSFVVAAALLALFAWRAEHHPVPVVDPALYRVRTFAAANVAMLTFSIGFAASLLIAILWLQDVWHWSPIETGFAVAPGPCMVPLFALVAQRLSRRVPAGVLASVGCLCFALGSVLTLSLVGQQPHYASEILPGWLVGGTGVGLALPTLLSSATVDLPPQRTSTGSGVITMTRQIGFVLGVSVLVAILGTPGSYADAHRVFRHGWLMIAAVEVVAAAAALAVTPRRQALTR